jgi:hypothetical protein
MNLGQIRVCLLSVVVVVVVVNMYRYDSDERDEVMCRKESLLESIDPFPSFPLSANDRHQLNDARWSLDLGGR